MSTDPNTNRATKICNKIPQNFDEQKSTRIFDKYGGVLATYDLYFSYNIEFTVKSGR